MENEVNGANASNPKMNVVRSKNQIDFFMHNYTVYKKSGVVVIDVMEPAADGEDLHSFYELTKEEFESDDFRVLADAIRKNPQQYADRRIL